MSGANVSERSDEIVPAGEQRSPRTGITTLELPLPDQAAERWIRFGAPVLDQVLHRRCRLLCFVPDSIFALVRWASNDGGTAQSRIDIVRAVAPGEAYSTLADVAPGGEQLLQLFGWSKVRDCLTLIEAIEDLAFDPCAVAPDYWRYAHNRLIAGHRAHAYSRARHRAWLLRRSMRA